MLTGEIRGQIDRIWDSFWTGGISNPLEVIEQITYLLFLRRLDELQTLEDLKASRLNQPAERRLFLEGKDSKKTPVRRPPLVTLLELRGPQDARFTIPIPGLLTKGDVYEYMLSKIATAGQNGQFRTPLANPGRWKVKPLIAVGPEGVVSLSEFGFRIPPSAQNRPETATPSASSLTSTKLECRALLLRRSFARSPFQPGNRFPNQALFV